MLNKVILKDKFEKLIVGSTEAFANKVSKVEEFIKRSKLSGKDSLLIYGSDSRNAIYYTLGVYYSLRNNRVLDYVVSTGQHFINQHFLESTDKDKVLYNQMYYSDLLFISLSQFDYTSDYLESLLIDLVETRSNNQKYTIIYFDVLDSKDYLRTTIKLNNYFDSNHLTLDMTKGSTSTKKTPKTRTERFI